MGAKELFRPVLPELIRISVSSNKIGNVGVANLIEGMASHPLGLPKLKYINLNGVNNLIGDDGKAALASALSNGAMQGLEELSVWNPTSGLSAACSARGINGYGSWSSED